MKMAIPKVLLLRASDESVPLTWNPGVSFEPIVCPVDPGHQRGGRRVGPLNVDYPGASLKHDIVRTWYSEYLISDRLARSLHRWGATGYKTNPVVITSRQSKPRQDYRELVVTGWGGVARPEAGVRLLESCPACGQLYYSGVQSWHDLIDWSAWDGSDLFMVWPLPRYILVVERVATLLSESGFGGFKMVPFDEMEPQEGLAPGRVTYWLTEEKALALGVSPEIL
jgi:hypothetical protein